MKKTFVASSILLLGAIVLTVTLHAASSSDKALKDLLNSQNYILASPAVSWPYPGGLLVARKGSVTFIDLPKSVNKPQSSSGPVDFMAEKQTKKFSISAILTGMLSLIGGNPGAGFGKSSNVTVQEIKAEASRIEFGDAQSILQSPEVRDTVRKWAAVQGQQVFVLGVVVSTKNINVSSDTNTNLDLSFNGKALPNCSGSGTSNDKTAGGTPSKPDTASAAPADASKAKKGDSTKKSNTSKKESTASNTTKSDSGTGSKGGDSSASSGTASGPGGELHFCNASNNSVSMSTDKPLVFGGAAYPVTLAKDGSLELQPTFKVPSAGRFENTTGLQSRWHMKSWADRDTFSK